MFEGGFEAVGFINYERVAFSWSVGMGYDYSSVYITIGPSIHPTSTA